MPFFFLLLPKAEVGSVTGGTYSGITGAGSGAIGLRIGVYAGKITGSKPGIII